MKGIELKNLTKKYKDTVALSDVSLTIEHGKIYGLLGRNGAGKSRLARYSLTVSRRWRMTLFCARCSR